MFNKLSKKEVSKETAAGTHTVSALAHIPLSTREYQAARGLASLASSRPTLVTRKKAKIVHSTQTQLKAVRVNKSSSLKITHVLLDKSRWSKKP